MCTKFNNIYNKLHSEKQSGDNDFDVLKATKDQYRVEIGHVFKFNKSWEVLRRDPKWNQTPTQTEVQSKRSKNSSLVNVSDATDSHRPQRRH